jgi:hypothetical protein
VENKTRTFIKISLIGLPLVLYAVQESKPVIPIKVDKQINISIDGSSSFRSKYFIGIQRIQSPNQ